MDNSALELPGDDEQSLEDEDVQPSFEQMKSKQATKHVQVGSDYLFRRRFYEALTEFSKATFLDPDRAEVYVLKSKCFEMLCDFKSSIANMRKAVRLNPEQADWRRHLSIMVDAQGQSHIRMLSSTNLKNGAGALLIEALSYFAEAIEIEETIPEYWLHRCLTYIRLTQWKKALSDINQYIFLLEEEMSELEHANGLDLNESLVRAIGAPSAMADRKAAAASVMQQRRQYNNRLCAAFVMRAKLYWRLEIVTKAKSDLDRAHYLNPEHAEVQILKRIIARQNERTHTTTSRLILGGQMKAALKELNQALKLNPEDVQMLLLRAAVYRKLDYHKESLADIDRATMAHRTSIQLHYELKQRSTSTRRSRRRAKQAMTPEPPKDEDIDEPLQITVMRNLTLNEAALNSLCEGHASASRDVFEQIIESQQEIARKNGNRVDPLFFVNRGDSYATSGRWKEALKDYMQAYQMSPNGWKIRSRISLVYHKLGSTRFNERRYLEAVRIFTIAIKHLDTVPDYYVSRGAAYLEHKNYKLAHADFKKALELDPNHRVALLRIMQFEPAQSQAERFANRLLNQRNASSGVSHTSRPKTSSSKLNRNRSSTHWEAETPTTPWGTPMPPMKHTLRVKHAHKSSIRGMVAATMRRRSAHVPSGRPFNAVTLPYVWNRAKR